MVSKFRLYFHDSNLLLYPEDMKGGCISQDGLYVSTNYGQKWNIVGNGVYVSQWSGIKDTKDIDIYEGDIITKAGDYRIYRVIHDNITGAKPFHPDYFKNKKDRSLSLHFFPCDSYKKGAYYKADQWTVIGNIYHNIGLLYKKKDTQQFQNTQGCA